MIRVKNASFHFWDAVDDFSRTNMDLIFEQDRLYLHDTSGHFGAVPMSITGMPHLSCYLLALTLTSASRQTVTFRPDRHTKTIIVWPQSFTITTSLPRSARAFMSTVCKQSMTGSACMCRRHGLESGLW
jgi:hypothetical protein